MSILNGARFKTRRGVNGLSFLTRFAIAGTTAAGLVAAVVIGEVHTRMVAAADTGSVTPAASSSKAVEANRALTDAKREFRISKLRRDDVAAPDAALEFGGSTKIQANDGTPGSQFGGSVAISGTTVVVGAPASASTTGGTGSAYIYVLTNGTWTLQQKLTAADGELDDAFGTSVAIAGDTAVVGAFGDAIGTNTNQGSVYVFVRSGTTWTQQQKLTATGGAANDYFGRVVAVAGDTVAVGASGADGAANVDQGAAYVFTRTGTTWAQQAKLTAGDGAALDYFGDSVSISGETVVVGATEDAAGPNLQQGSAYVFTRSGTTWTQQAKLTAIDGTAFDYFGFSVSVDGDTAVVGTLQDVGINFQQGSAYVFTRSGTAWTQQQKIVAADGGPNDSFGNSVFVLGDTVMIGAAGDTHEENVRQGSAYVFTRSGTAWTQSQKLLAADGGPQDEFGSGVAFTAGRAIVGSVSDTVGANTLQGSAYIFSTQVTISGRVTTPGGQNLRNAIVSLIDQAGVRRTATTSSFGIYSFTGVRPGETYTMTVGSKRYRFTPKILPVDSALSNVDFVGLE